MTKIIDVLGPYRFATVMESERIESLYFKKGRIRLADAHGPKIVFAKCSRHLLAKDVEKKDGIHKMTDLAWSENIKEAAELSKTLSLFELSGNVGEFHMSKGYPCLHAIPQSLATRIESMTFNDIIKILQLVKKTPDDDKSNDDGCYNDVIKWKIKLKDKDSPSENEKEKLGIANAVCIAFLRAFGDMK